MVGGMWGHHIGWTYGSQKNFLTSKVLRLDPTVSDSEDELKREQSGVKKISAVNMALSFKTIGCEGKGRLDDYLRGICRIHFTEGCKSRPVKLM